MQIYSMFKSFQNFCLRINRNSNTPLNPNIPFNINNNNNNNNKLNNTSIMNGSGGNPGMMTYLNNYNKNVLKKLIDNNNIHNTNKFRDIIQTGKNIDNVEKYDYYYYTLNNIDSSKFDYIYITTYSDLMSYLNSYNHFFIKRLIDYYKFRNIIDKELAVINVKQQTLLCDSNNIINPNNPLVYIFTTIGLVLGLRYVNNIL